MSLHHDDQGHAEGRIAPPRPRRDPLGLWSLLGPDSVLVPISDYDGAAGCSGHAPAPGDHADHDAPRAESSACGSCTSIYPSSLLGLGNLRKHFQRSSANEEPS